MVRLRATAFPTFLEAMIPSRDTPWLAGATYRMKLRVTKRRPVLRTVANPLEAMILCSLGNPKRTFSTIYLCGISTASFFLPLARRRRIISRPLLVAILALKPWVLFRRRLCG